MVGDFNQKTNRSQQRRGNNQSSRSKCQTSGSGKGLKRRKKWFYFFPFCLIILLGLLQLYFSNRLATQGQRLTIDEKEISLIEEENKRLKSEIASLGGLNKLIEIASEKGFVENPSVVNLSTKVPVALKSK